MRRLRILITNNALAGRAGTELVVRDLAVALQKRGHAPICYSSVLGEVAEELRRSAVPVLSRLDHLSEPIDLIHGHHHVETMTAVLRFPDTPAIYCCHGWLPWEEMPVVHPRIRRYVAVDQACHDRLQFEGGIREKDITTIANAVDLNRFSPRTSWPVYPRRALVFDNYASEGGFLPLIREACTLEGIELDVAGSGAGRPCADPENLLGHYDLVFAKARCALEALAAGAAVILVHTRGTGPLITFDELASLRDRNFGIRCMNSSWNVATVREQIRRYNATDNRRVMEKIREIAGLDTMVDRYLDLYQKVLNEPFQFAFEETAQAEAAYLARISPRAQEANSIHLQRELVGLRLSDHRLQQTNAEQHRQIERSQQANANLLMEIEQLRTNLAQVRGSVTVRIRERLRGIRGIGWLRFLLRPLRRIK